MSYSLLLLSFFTNPDLYKLGFHIHITELGQVLHQVTFFHTLHLKVCIHQSFWCISNFSPLQDSTPNFNIPITILTDFTPKYLN